MTTYENLSKLQKTRATLHRDVLSICREACHLLGMEITKPAMEVIAELLFKKLSIYALDLEAFAKHAKRSTINGEDVKLLVRRNPSLKQHLITTLLSNQPPTSKDMRRKTNAATLPIAKEVIPAMAKPEAEREKQARDKEQLHSDFEMNDDIENVILQDTIDLTFD